MLLTVAYHKGNRDFAEAQADHIRRLCPNLKYPVLYVVDGCESIDYDGISDDLTELRVDLSEFTYPFVGSEVFRVCAKEAERRKLNWVFLEPDCLILKSNFMTLLETELLMSGKRAVFTNCRHEPHDLVTGNGAYRTDVATIWKPAIDATETSWDGHADKHYSHDICRSPLIFHKYGEYDERGYAHPFDLWKEDLSLAVVAHKMYSLKVYEEFKCQK